MLAYFSQLSHAYLWHSASAYLGYHTSRAALLLAKAGIYNGRNLNRIQSSANQHQAGIVATLECLSNVGLLNQHRFDLLMGSRYTSKLVAGTQRLEQGGLLNKSNFQILIQHDLLAKVLAHLLVRLNNANLLKPENLNRILTQIKDVNFQIYGVSIPALEKCITALSRVGLLTQRNFDDLIPLTSLMGSLGKSYACLAESKILSQENINLLLKHVLGIEQLSSVLTILKRQDLLDNHNFKVLTQKTPYALFDAETVMGQNNALAKALHAIGQSELLTQENFDAIMQSIECLSDRQYLAQCDVLDTMEYLEKKCSAIAGKPAHIRPYDLFLSCIIIVSNQGLLDQTVLDTLIKHKQLAMGFYIGLVALQKCNTSDDAFFRRYFPLLIRHIKFSQELGLGIGILASDDRIQLSLYPEAQSDKLLEQYLDLLLQKPASAESLASGLVNLSHAKLLDSKYIALIKAHAQYANGLAACFKVLNDAKLLNDAMVKSLIDKVEHVDTLAQGFHVLAIVYRLDSFYKTLIQSAAHADKFAHGINLLVDANILDRYHNDLEKCPQHADTLANGFVILHDADLVDKYYDVLIQHPLYAVTLANSLVELTKAGLIDKVLGSLLKYPDNALSASGCFILLNSCDLLAQQATDQIAKNAGRLGIIFQLMLQSGLLNNENISTILDKLEYTEQIVFALRAFHEVEGMVLPQNIHLNNVYFKELTQNAQYAAELAFCIIFLNISGFYEDYHPILEKFAPYLHLLSVSVTHLEKYELLSQSNLDKLIRLMDVEGSPPTHVLLGLNCIANLTQKIFDDFITMCEQSDFEPSKMLTWQDESRFTKRVPKFVHHVETKLQFNYYSSYRDLVNYRMSFLGTANTQTMACFLDIEEMLYAIITFAVDPNYSMKIWGQLYDSVSMYLKSELSAFNNTLHRHEQKSIL